MKQIRFTFIIISAVLNIFFTGNNVFPQCSVLHQDSLNVIFGGEDGTILKSTNSGFNWIEQSTGITNVIYSVDINRFTDESQNEQIIYFASCENGIVLRSNLKSGGWDILNTGYIADLKSICIKSKGEIFACGNGGLIISSADNGNSWNTMNSGTGENLNVVIFPGENTYGNRIYPIAAGSNGTVLISRNSGYSWIPVQSGTSAKLNTAVYGELQYVFAAGDNGVMIRSADGGSSWQTLNTDISADINKLEFIKSGANSKLAASCDNGIILISQDLGNTWSIIQSPALLDLFSVSFYDLNTGIAAADENNFLYTSNGGFNWFTLPSSTGLTAENNAISLSQNYPNPFNPVTTINFTLNFEGYAELKIFDITGKEVRTLVNSYKQKGTYSAVLDASNLSSGFYFYKLYYTNGINKFIETRKMLFVK